MTKQATSNERLIKFLQATPEIQEQIDRILDGKVLAKVEPTTGPLLYNLSQAARILNLSRTSLWRAISAGHIEKVEVLPGIFRIRSADILAVVNGKKGVR